MPQSDSTPAPGEQSTREGVRLRHVAQLMPAQPETRVVFTVDMPDDDFTVETLQVVAWALVDVAWWRGPGNDPPSRHQWETLVGTEIRSIHRIIDAVALFGRFGPVMVCELQEGGEFDNGCILGCAVGPFEESVWRARAEARSARSRRFAPDGAPPDEIARQLAGVERLAEQPGDGPISEDQP